MSISVLIPVLDPEPYLPNVVDRLEEIARTYPGLICEELIWWEGSLSEARLSMLEQAKAPFVLNLDSDSMIPLDYPARALEVFKLSDKVGAVALDYHPKPQGHVAFGTSIMRADIMKKVYTWKNIHDSEACECMHVWRALHKRGLIVASLPLWAEHKKVKVCPG